MSNFKKVNTRGSVTKSHAFIVQKINIINDKFEAMPGIAARKISTLLTKTCIENYIREEKFLGNKIPRVPHKIPFEGAINYDDTYDTSLDPSLLLTPKKTKSLAEQYTPVSTKASQIRDQSEAAHMQYDPERGMNLVSYTTIIANHLINSPAVKERVAMQTSLKTLTTSHPLDYIAINIIKNSGSLTHQTCGKIFTSIIYTQEHSAENIQTKTYEKKYNQTKTKASLVLGIGSYTKIAQKAQWIMTEGNIDDTVLASYLKAASNGFKLEVTGLTHKQIAFIIHLNALLFGEEAHRHTSSYLINHMFIDLIEDGIFTFKDLPSKLPMAITKAVMASRTLDHHLFKAIKTHTPYDTSTKMHDINAKEVKELMSRSYNVISEWLKQNGVSATDIQQAELGGEALVSIVNIIKNGVTKWYNYTLETFPILEQNEHMQDAMPSHQSINIHNPMIFKHTTGQKLSFIDHSPLHSPHDSTLLIDLDDLELAHTEVNTMLGHTIDGIVWD